MSKNRLMLAFSVLMIAAMLFTACAPKPTEAPTQAPAPTKPAEQPTAVAPTEEPTPEPSTRVGGWLDEIVMSVVSGDSAVT